MYYKNLSIDLPLNMLHCKLANLMLRVVSPSNEASLATSAVGVKIPADTF